MMFCLLPGFLSLGWRISRIRNEETLPRVAQSSATTLPGDRGELWAGPGLGAEQRSGLLYFLNGYFKAWPCPTLDVQGRSCIHQGEEEMGMGMGMAPTFQCPGEGTVWISLPWRMEAEPGCSLWPCPGLGHDPMILSLIPSGGTGNPPGCGFSPSSCLQPIPGVASAIVDVAELQDSLAEPPGQG